MASGGVDHAIALAEAEAERYADALGFHYLGLAQAYAMNDEFAHGAEVYSLIRDSDLPADAHLNAVSTPALNGRATSLARRHPPRLRRVMVRMAGVSDVAALAHLRGIGADKLAAFAGWVAAHAETHLPFVAEIDGDVVGAAWLLVAERVPGFSHHRQLLLWEPAAP